MRRADSPLQHSITKRGFLTRESWPQFLLNGEVAEGQHEFGWTESFSACPRNNCPKNGSIDYKLAMRGFVPP